MLAVREVVGPRIAETNPRRLLAALWALSANRLWLSHARLREKCLTRPLDATFVRIGDPLGIQRHIRAKALRVQLT